MTLAIYHRPTLLPSLRKPPASRGIRGQIIAPSFLMQRYFTTPRLASRIKKKKKKKNSLTLLLFLSFFFFFSLSLPSLWSSAIPEIKPQNRFVLSLLFTDEIFIQKEYKIYSLSYLTFRDEYLTKLAPFGTARIGRNVKNPAPEYSTIPETERRIS